MVDKFRSNGRIILITLRNPFIYGLHDFKVISGAFLAELWHFTLIWGPKVGVWQPGVLP